MATSKKKGRTQCRRLPALCGVWGRVVFLAPSLTHTNVQRLGLEPGTFRLQTVGSTAAPGPPFIYRAGMQKKKRMASLLYSVDALLCILSTKSWLQTLAKEGIVGES